MTTGVNSDGSGRFLVVKGSGGAGLGDKIRALPSAIAYAKLTGRKLYVDWNDPAYGDGRLNYFPQLFQLDGVPCTEMRPLGGCVRPASWQDKLHLNWDQLYAEFGSPAWNRKWAQEVFSFDQAVLSWPESILVMWDFDQFDKLYHKILPLTPGLSPGSTMEDCQGAILKRHLRLSAGMQAALEPWLARLNAIRPVVGVHVRAAADVHWTRRVPQAERYCVAVDRLMRKLGGGGIFLATDNSHILELFRKRFGDDKVHSTDKWLPPPGVSLQLENDCPDRLQSARDALLDIHLLAACDGLVTMRNSSFSILSRMFSACGEERQVVLQGRPPILERMWDRIVKYARH